MNSGWHNVEIIEPKKVNKGNNSSSVQREQFSKTFSRLYVLDTAKARKSPGLRQTFSDLQSSTVQCLALMRYLANRPQAALHCWPEMQVKGEKEKKAKQRMWTNVSPLCTLDASVVDEMSEEALRGKLSSIVSFILVCPVYFWASLED